MYPFEKQNIVSMVLCASAFAVAAVSMPGTTTGPMVCRWNKDHTILHLVDTKAGKPTLWPAVHAGKDVHVKFLVAENEINTRQIRAVVDVADRCDVRVQVPELQGLES